MQPMYIVLTYVDRAVHSYIHNYTVHASAQMHYLTPLHS